MIIIITTVGMTFRLLFKIFFGSDLPIAEGASCEEHFLDLERDQLQKLFGDRHLFRAFGRARGLEPVDDSLVLLECFLLDVHEVGHIVAVHA